MPNKPSEVIGLSRLPVAAARGRRFRFFPASPVLWLLIGLLLLLLPPAAGAEPLLAAGEDLSGSVFLPFRQEAPEEGGYTWTWRLPHMAEEDPRAHLVNAYFDYYLEDSLANAVPLMAESLAESGLSAEAAVDYTMTCNTGRLISFLMSATETIEGESQTIYEGLTFSLEEGMPGSSLSLPQILGFLDPGAAPDTWLEDRQTEKANRLVRSLVADRLKKLPEGSLLPEYSEEMLSWCFFPDQDFYLDENGSPVFYLQPGAMAPASGGRLDFPISLEELLDEW